MTSSGPIIKKIMYRTKRMTWLRTCSSELILHRVSVRPDEVFQRLIDDLHPECVFRIDLKVAESLVVGHGVIRVLRQILVRPARLVRHLRMTSTCHQCVTKQCHQRVTRNVVNVSPNSVMNVSPRLSSIYHLEMILSVSVFVRLSVCPSVYQCVRTNILHDMSHLLFLISDSLLVMRKRKTLENSNRTWNDNDITS